MTTIAYAAIQLCIGIAIGFFLDKWEWEEEKHQATNVINLDEIIISTLAFMTINIFALKFNTKYNIQSFIILTIGWFSIMAGIVIGNIGRSSMINKILNVIKKKDIQLILKDMIQLSYRYIHNTDDASREKLMKLENEIICALEQVITSMVKLNNPRMQRRFENLKKLCHEYIELTEIIATEKDIDKKDMLIKEWIEISELLSKISWDTLNHAQEEIMRRFRTIWGKENRG